MRKMTLRTINRLLAVLIAMLGVQNMKASKEEVQKVVDAPQDEVIYCMYAGPSYFFDKLKEKNDSTQANSTAVDSTQAELTVVEASEAQEEKAEAPKENRQPLYLLNGKEIPAEGFSQLEPSHIREIKVLSPEQATEKYGEAGKYGALEITSMSGR